MPRKPAADSLARALDRAEAVLARLEALLPVPPAEPDWKAHAFRWRKRGERGQRMGKLDDASAGERRFDFDG